VWDADRRGPKSSAPTLSERYSSATVPPPPECAPPTNTGTSSESPPSTRSAVASAPPPWESATSCAAKQIARSRSAVPWPSAPARQATIRCHYQTPPGRRHDYWRKVSLHWQESRWRHGGETG